MASFPPSEPMNEFWPRRRHSWLAGVALGLLFATSTAGVHAEVEPVENNTANPTTGNGRTLFSGPIDSNAHLLFAPRLKKALEESYDIELAPRSYGDILNAVASDSSLNGFVTLDVFYDFRTGNPELASNLEFYGKTPVCLFGAVNSKAINIDMKSESASPRHIDIGPVDRSTYVMVSALTPDLMTRSDITFEHRGGYRALEQTSNNAEHVALFTAYPHLSSLELDYVNEHDQLELSRAIDRVLGPIDRSILASKGYMPKTVALPKPGWMPGTIEYRTVCTTLGIVVNSRVSDEADRLFTEALVRTVTAIDKRSEYTLQAVFDELWDFANDVSEYSLKQINKGWESL